MDHQQLLISSSRVTTSSTTSSKCSSSSTRYNRSKRTNQAPARRSIFQDFWKKEGTKHHNQIHPNPTINNNNTTTTSIKTKPIKYYNQNNKIHNMSNKMMQEEVTSSVLRLNGNTINFPSHFSSSIPSTITTTRSSINTQCITTSNQTQNHASFKSHNTCTNQQNSNSIQMIPPFESIHSTSSSTQAPSSSPQSTTQSNTRTATTSSLIRSKSNESSNSTDKENKGRRIVHFSPCVTVMEYNVPSIYSSEQQQYDHQQEKEDETKECLQDVVNMPTKRAVLSTPPPSSSTSYTITTTSSTTTEKDSKWFTEEELNQFRQEALSDIKKVYKHTSTSTTYPSSSLLPSTTSSFSVDRMVQSHHHHHQPPSKSLLYCNPALRVTSEDTFIHVQSIEYQIIQSTQVQSILIVDPHLAFHALYTRALRRIFPNVVIETAKNGPEALQKCCTRFTSAAAAVNASTSTAHVSCTSQCSSSSSSIATTSTTSTTTSTDSTLQNTCNPQCTHDDNDHEKEVQEVGQAMFDMIIVEERLWGSLMRVQDHPHHGSGSSTTTCSRRLSGNPSSGSSSDRNTTTSSSSSSSSTTDNTNCGEETKDASSCHLDTSSAHAMSGSELIRLIQSYYKECTSSTSMTNADLHFDDSSNDLKKEEKVDDSLVEDIFGLSLCQEGVRGQRQQQSTASPLCREPLFIGTSSYLGEDCGQLRRGGADILWGKPPPTMDAHLRNELLSDILEKRGLGMVVFG